jgi:hypothetical protein
MHDTLPKYIQMCVQRHRSMRLLIQSNSLGLISGLRREPVFINTVAAWLLFAMGIRKTMTQRELQIIKNMKKKLKIPITKIALATDRNKSTIYSALKLKKFVQHRGRPQVLTPKLVRRLITILKAMIKKAKGRREITMAMLIKRSKVKMGGKAIRKSLAKKGIRFRRLRSKPLLTKEDKTKRFRFGKKYRNKPVAFWRRLLSIDCKNFPAYVSAKARDYAAMREVRGAYRERGEGLDEAYVTVPKDLRYNPGAKPVKILGGVAKGRVCVWHDYGSKWNGKVAADCYLGPIKKGLKKTWPRRRSFKVLEDNDPTGFKSKQGIKAKKAAQISVFEIPPRSPDLSVMDYAIWRAINKKMRNQERKFPRSKRETRSAYRARLQRAALSLPKQSINKAIGSMKRRCQLIYKAKGGHIEEGGHHNLC